MEVAARGDGDLEAAESGVDGRAAERCRRLSSMAGPSRAQVLAEELSCRVDSSPSKRRQEAAKPGATSSRRRTSVRAHQMATELLPEDTLLREEKLAAMVQGSGERPRMDATHSGDGARLLMRTVAREVRYDVEVRSQYGNLALFCSYVALMLAMITLQRGVADGSGRLQALAAKTLWLGKGMDVNGDEALVDNELVNASGIYRHLASNVAQVFAYPSCGNTVCEEPDEFPFWRAAEDARALPGGCVFDCGSIATVEVTITFFDAFKYLAAVDLVESLAYQDLV